MTGGPPSPALPPNLPRQFVEPGGRLPDSMLETVRGLAEGTIEPAAPKPAATVVLLRDGAGGIEAYLLRRVRSMAFAAGMTVFPGGSVDRRDAELPAAAFHGVELDSWCRPLSADRGLTAALACAAVRETFEESGVMLAGAPDGRIVADTSGDDWEADRQALLDRSLSLAALLTRRRLVLRADLLRPWAHWITPEIEPRRYDTRFFVAALPAGQRTRDVGGEADQVSWARPVEALRAAEAGEVAMLPPTAFTLAELSAYDTVAEVLAAGAERDIKPVLPRLVVDGDDAQLLLPHDDPSPGDPDS